MQSSLGHARRRHARSHLLSVHGVRRLARSQTAFLIIGVVFLVVLVARKTKRQSGAGAHRRFLLAQPSKSFDRHGTPSGLSELLGRRKPLDRHAALDSATWDPTSAWFREQPMAALFPTCQHPQWCDDQYDPAETDRVQRALWAHQNPADCGSARYLVLDSAWNKAAGLGSSLHMHMYFLALALTSDRILVPADDLRWTYATPGLCGPDQGASMSVSDDAGTRAGTPANLHSRYLDCYFLPTTRCRLDAAAQRSAPQATSLHEPHKVVHLRAYHSVLNTTFCELTVQSSAPGLVEFQERPPSWWYAQLTKFVVRPTEHTLRDLVWPLQQAAFFTSQGRLPHPLAAIFIRAGDKGSESPLRSVDEHFAALAPLARQLNIRDVYVGSDSASRLAEAVEMYGHAYRLHYINWQRPGDGLAMPAVRAAAGTARIADLTRLALADLAITAQADVLVGTLSSNWLRLADELRRAGGKARVPVATPEGRLYYSQCEETGPGGEVGSVQHMERVTKIVQSWRPV